MKRLILGGAKSGKSQYAETLVSSLSSSVTVIATATVLDEEMAVRVARHQEVRPSSWLTLEEPVYLGKAIRSINNADVVLVDCLTLWLTNLLMLADVKELEVQIDDFESAVKASKAQLILVSNETNMGIVPLGDLTRRYCDQVGLLHQRIAKICDKVELIVAGLPLILKS